MAILCNTSRYRWGLSAIALTEVVDWVSGFSVGLPIFIAPAIGGLIVSVIYLIDRDALGAGTRNYLNAVNLYQGKIHRRT